MRERRMRRGRARGSGAAAQSRPIPAPPPGPAGRGGSDCAARRCPATRGRRREAKRGEGRAPARAGVAVVRAVRGARSKPPPRKRRGSGRAGPAAAGAAGQRCPRLALTRVCPFPSQGRPGRAGPRGPWGWALCWCPSRRLPVPSGVPGSLEGSAVRCDPAVRPRPWHCRASARRGQESSPCSARSPQCGHLLPLLAETWAPGAKTRGCGVCLAASSSEVFPCKYCIKSLF